MKSLKTRILATLFMGIVAMTAPIRSNTDDQNSIGASGYLYGAAFGVACLLPIMIHDTYQAYKLNLQNKKKKAALDSMKPAASHEQITVKKGEEFTIERKANLESGQEWSVRTPENIFELSKNKTSTHITVQEGQDFTIAAPKTGAIEANYFTPYIPYKALQVLPGEQLEDKDLFRLTALKKGHYELYIEQHVRLEDNKPCIRITHDIFVHVE